MGHPHFINISMVKISPKQFPKQKKKHVLGWAQDPHISLAGNTKLFSDLREL